MIYIVRAVITDADTDSDNIRESLFSGPYRHREKADSFVDSIRASVSSEDLFIEVMTVMPIGVRAMAKMLNQLAQ